MLKTANLHMRIDPETKKGAEQLYSSFGISLSDAVLIFLRQSLMVGGLPFEMRQPQYNAQTEAAIAEARGIMDGNVQTKTFSSLADFYEDLDSEDDEDEA